MRWSSKILGVLLAMSPAFACAHEGRADPQTWWRTWNADPLVLLSLGLLAAFYGRGIDRLWARVGWGAKIRVRQVTCFWGAWLLLVVALVSPLDPLADELSSLHMVQHMLLMMGAAPLLVLSSPTVVLAWGIRGWKSENSNWLRALFRFLNHDLWWHPMCGALLFAAVTWGWHHPLLYRAALRDPLVHDFQHVSFFVAGYLFWRPLIAPEMSRRLTAPAATAYLFGTSIHTMALGVFMTLSPAIWYVEYRGRTDAWGLTVREDQQLAGLIMWMPACLVFPAVAAALFGLWLSSQMASTPRSYYGLALRGE